MAHIFSHELVEWKRRNKIHNCEGKTPFCLRKFLKTRGKDQKYCLNCLKEFARIAPRMESQREQILNKQTLVGDEVPGAMGTNVWL